jgi:hypothetical protein
MRRLTAVLAALLLSPMTGPLAAGGNTVSVIDAMSFAVVPALPFPCTRSPDSRGERHDRSVQEASVRLLLTSAGVKNPSIHNALVDLLGKPIADCGALCIPTAMYGHPNVGPGEGHGGQGRRYCSRRIRRIRSPPGTHTNTRNSPITDQPSGLEGFISSEKITVMATNGAHVHQTCPTSHSHR